MGIIKNFINRMAEGVGIIHPRESWGVLGVPNTRIDYARAVGTGLESNVNMSPVQWIMRTFPESPVKLEKMDKKGGKERIFDHSFLALLNNPNPNYSYEALIMGTMLSYNMAGNAYWLKVRNGLNGVIELWYAPHWLITPKSHDTDQSIFIDHYDYNPNGTVFAVPIEDVVHFKFGIDPRNPRLGLSPLAAVLREIATDDEAAIYSLSMLHNNGVPGMIISPDGDETIRDTELKEAKEYFAQEYTGEKRGRPLVMSGRTKVSTYAFDPSKMALPKLRNISEERVCAALGIPPAVVGFGTGLQATKVGATMNAMIGLAYDSNIIPSQKVISSALERQLLPDFDNDKSLQIGYDNSNIGALQEDKDKKVLRIGKGVTEGWAMVADARRAEGLTVEDEDEVYLRPLGVVEVEE